MGFRQTSSLELAWQGWRMAVPVRWNPVRIEGDYDSGYVLLSDLHGPRLGLRWRRAGRRFDAASWARKALRQEVGMVASEEARPVAAGPEFESSLLFTDPTPPGRDVWVAYSTTSRRAVELVYRSRRRERVLSPIILPTFSDQAAEQSVRWSIFGISCIVPAGLRLVRHQLNAGDLTLSFAGRGHELLVRQVSLAQQALRRMPMEKWLNQVEWARRSRYRRRTEPVPVALDLAGRRLEGLRGVIQRKRRFFMAWRLPKEIYSYALHDPDRDRLVFVQSTDDQSGAQAVQSIGWAGDSISPPGL